MKLAVAITTIFALATSSYAWPPIHPHGAPWDHPSGSQSSWNLANFSSLVAFGDSYTDDSRLGYFISNAGQAPPLGWVDPVNYHSADGGRTWVEYVRQYTGISLYNYAVSGAVCSNNITPRYFSAIDAPFPDIEQYELPAYIADSNYYYPNGTKFMNDPSNATVYAMWIGTNDLGFSAFIQDAQVNGTNINNYTDCVFDQLARVYDNGGRYFVLMNVAPLNLAPIYALPKDGGVGNNQYWNPKTGNYTEISYKMMEYVTLVNSIFEYRTPYAVEVTKRFPGASFAVYDVHGLMTDIYNNPSEYLNGTTPSNVTGYVHHCNLTGGDCVTNPSPDSFLWFDELHPSEQTERVIARIFLDVVKGASKWATYWSS